LRNSVTCNEQQVHKAVATVRLAKSTPKGTPPLAPSVDGCAEPRCVRGASWARGSVHGVGCCWALMAALFALGVHEASAVWLSSPG
jgi:hypothetical protein